MNIPGHLSIDELEAAVDRIPRCILGEVPTPLRRLGRLSVQLDREVYLKRDDHLGPLVGGNKTRKLEYQLHETARGGAHRIVTVGGPQSNHCRLTAACARLLDLETHLLLMGSPPRRNRGNLLLDELVGAHLHFVSSGPLKHGPCAFGELDEHFRCTADELVGGHAFIPIGGSNPRGSLGYVRAATELHRQCEAAGIGNARIVLAAGSGGTLAGLWAGLTLIGSGLEVLGIDVGRLWSDFPEHVAQLATDTCGLIGLPLAFEPEAAPLIEDRYVGRRYGKPTEAGRRAIELLATTEGVVLDPTYTSKAFSGLLDLVSQGNLGDDEPVIFLHTGGLPGLLA